MQAPQKIRTQESAYMLTALPSYLVIFLKTYKSANRSNFNLYGLKNFSASLFGIIFEKILEGWNNKVVRLNANIKLNSADFLK